MFKNLEKKEIDENLFDIIVVGNGLIGSAAIKYLALQGKKVIGIGPGWKKNNYYFIYLFF
jgi:RAB protein geranylgeranyltransferase component A